MLIKTMPLSAISPYQKNPRKNDRAVFAVQESLEKFGWRQPIVIDKDGIIVVGHTRYFAAINLGLIDAPVHVADNLSSDQIDACRLADNKTHDLAEWDHDLLAEEIGRLVALDVDIPGFDADDIDAIICQKTELPERLEVLRPISMTRMLISVPSGVALEHMDAALAEVIRRGGVVDYGGN